MDTDQPIYQRTMEEVIESIRHGELYFVVRIHGDRVRCRRVRNTEKRGVIATDEWRTFYKRASSKLQPAEKDFIFVDKGGGNAKPTVSLFHVDRDSSMLYGLTREAPRR